MEHLRLLNPLEFHLQRLRSGKRVGRTSLSEFQAVSLQVNVITTSHGSALAKHGETCVIASVKGELSPTDTPSGLCTVNFDLATGLDSSDAVTDVASARHLLQAMLSSDDLLNKQQLFIAGKWAWTLHCDLVCLDYHGSVIDCALTALIAALHSCRLPIVSVDTSEQIRCEQEKKSLVLLRMPTSSSFAFAEHFVLTDPSREELELFPAFARITVYDAETIRVETRGAFPLEQLAEVKECAKRRQKQLRALIIEAEKK